MPLKEYQKVIQPQTLYAIKVKGGVSGNGAQIAPSIEVIGTADIYGSQTEPDTAPNDMFQTREGFTGIEPFAVVPNYLYIDGAPDSIVLSGVEATEVV